MPDTQLSDRQLELLALFASGMDFEKIAAEKRLSYYTVRNLLHQGRINIGAKSLSHLVAIAFAEGWIEMNGERTAKVCGAAV